MRKKIFLVVVLAGLVAVVAIIQNVVKTEPIKIGLVAAMSGRTSQMGVSARNGIELAIENANAGGGLLGRKLQLVSKDNRSDPNMTYDVIKDLMAEEIHLILGPLTSNMAEPALKAIKGKDVLVVSPTISTDAVKDLDDNFIRTSSLTSQQALCIAEEVIRRGFKRAAIVYDASNKAYTEALYSLFNTIYSEKGGTISYVNSLQDKKNVSFFKIAGQIRASGAEVLVIVTSGIDAASLCQQIRKIQFPITVYGSSWVMTNDFIEHGGQSVEGVTLVSVFERAEKTETYRKFHRQFQTLFKRNPNFVSERSYEAASLVFAGIMAAKDIKPEKVKEAVLRIKTYKGLEETFSINEFGDAIRRLSIFTVKNGEFIKMEDR